jgi:hypothetical protein
VAVTKAAKTIRITTVRTKVAKSELIWETPTLAKTAVNAAKAADMRAHISQVECVCVGRPSMALESG